LLLSPVVAMVALALSLPPLLLLPVVIVVVQVAVVVDVVDASLMVDVVCYAQSHIMQLDSELVKQVKLGNLGCELRSK
jgi:hypothetical protein